MSALKTTVYRTSDESALAPALIKAAEAGKQTVCLVELKARFDERRNIGWSQRLEQAGVHVVHGLPAPEDPREDDARRAPRRRRLRRYAHIGTGNYHALTARSYEDLGLFTADPEITADVADLFNYLTGFGRPQRFRKLLVAPFTLRDRLLEEIRRVADAAGGGGAARIRIKVNALHDVPDDRGALPRLAGRRAHRDRRPQHLRAAAGGEGPQRDGHRPQRARPVPRAQPVLHLRRRRRPATTWAAPTSCRATSTTGSRS